MGESSIEGQPSRREPSEIEIRLRANEIRELTLRSIHAAGSGHPGGSLSCAEILAALYFETGADGRHRIEWDAGLVERDRVVLSKGHACPAWYSALHLRGWECGRRIIRPELDSLNIARPIAKLAS